MSMEGFSNDNINIGKCISKNSSDNQLNENEIQPKKKSANGNEN